MSIDAVERDVGCGIVFVLRFGKGREGREGPTLEGCTQREAPCGACMRCKNERRADAGRGIVVVSCLNRSKC
jgi:hypothetical protein